MRLFEGSAAIYTHHVTTCSLFLSLSIYLRLFFFHFSQLKAIEWEQTNWITKEAIQ